MDEFSEETSQGWLSRIIGSIKGILLGLLLFILAFPLLIWNESRSVDRVKTLEEGLGNVIHIEAGTVDKYNNERLVHLTAKATTAEVLHDNAFNLAVSALKLKRTVAIYQWQEASESKTEKQVGGSEKTIVNYSYHKVWHEGLINSDGFKNPEHKNPKTCPLQTTRSRSPM